MILACLLYIIQKKKQVSVILWLAAYFKIIKIILILLIPCAMLLLSICIYICTHNPCYLQILIIRIECVQLITVQLASISY